MKSRDHLLSKQFLNHVLSDGSITQLSKQHVLDTSHHLAGLVVGHKNVVHFVSVLPNLGLELLKLRYRFISHLFLLCLHVLPQQLSL